MISAVIRSSLSAHDGQFISACKNAHRSKARVQHTRARSGSIALDCLTTHVRPPLALGHSLRPAYRLRCLGLEGEVDTLRPRAARSWWSASERRMQRVHRVCVWHASIVPAFGFQLAHRVLLPNHHHLIPIASTPVMASD